jgi:ABC-type tungstate transport system permease subunit
MEKPVIVREEAEADLTEAYQWYEQQVRGLGDTLHIASSIHAGTDNF